MDVSDTVKIVADWTDSIKKDTISYFIEVQNQVFSTNYNEYRFARKFKNNIYGPSIIATAYVDGKCVGARAFWRNDLGELKAYQPCDTAVLEDYRGFGIFSKMNKKVLDIIGDRVIIYNFPNDNSLPGYLKLGWCLKSKKSYKLYNPFTDHSNIDQIEPEYLKWILSNRESDFNNSLFYTRARGNHYLLKKKRYNIYVIIGELDKSFVGCFSRAMFPICLNYSSNGYFGRGLVTVTRNLDEDINIPVYKMDTIF